ncbi:bifunctional 3,4-dihydroxy-2-butanone-4-phosphate synthase/GTP cyclohydrolase II [Rhodococcus sp. DMU1]|uniref:bifunctional 3,4-dihydroxy-2-butanone-4-phosphate synthase/GTP cyclohydrolase II n=1 Tax=Rhodococcus sp. DMU1 TaxID=2722825 RepID=UPI00143EEF8E|nr:bifunctional 3,4-dihydroxy-2-butanone-4-phosphate synthase/GTP cyclohydrolase II [Rhodococcus sp. DMU1]QIX54007.1 bifunctional 3,4-dihydroxy-2-butanone-4-phosphate synthase/GTP cyclohydrolase II [Rhodococcus sp. DMU1]
MSEKEITVTISTIETALDELRAGRMVVVVDDPGRENEGDLIGCAATITTDQVAFMVRHSTGILCAPMSAARAERLQLPQMVGENTDSHHTAFTVTVDHIDTTSGVSAADRARTLRALADPDCHATDLRRPGHVFPLVARAGGVLERAGHTEAAVDLLTLAGLPTVGVIGEIVEDSGAMRAGRSLDDFVHAHQLVKITIADLIRYRREHANSVVATGSAELPTEFGLFRAHAYRATNDGTEHLALTVGNLNAYTNNPAGVLVRVHSECLTGDLAGSLRCDCGVQFRESMRRIAAEGVGVLVYLRGHEGRGIGLGHKLRAYTLQERGADTVEANEALGLPVDSRDYRVGAEILVDLGVRRMRLITNNPDKYTGLDGYGLEIAERVQLPVHTTPENVAYLRTKRDRMGHLLDIPPAVGN